MPDTERRIKIKIADKAEGATRRDVLYEGVKSHDIDEAALQVVIERAKLELWKSDRDEGIAIGEKLYDFINGSGGKLNKIINDTVSRRENLYIYLDAAPDLTHLPFELMRDDARFLLLDERLQLIRLVSEDGWDTEVVPENRPLKMVFMVCSPTDLQTQSVLSFEREEELIIKSTEKYALDIRFEDSGSVAGLKDTLIDNGGCDILHIVGYADYDENNGPIFYMEYETGLLERITPDVLWHNIRENPPRMLFLSGCYTGRGGETGASGSFAYQMAKEGIPVVLGWGLPVSDMGATSFAAELYFLLSIGNGISKAVQKTRKMIDEVYYTWPLLRVFTNGEPLKAFIKAGQPVRNHTTRSSTYEYLEGTHVRVIKEGFIGRRRELQHGIRAIKGINGKYGAIIHGTGGNGKSCLAGKLIERFKDDKKLFVVHGVIKQVDIINGLYKLFDKYAIESATKLLTSNKTYEAKIKGLFRCEFNDMPVLIYFDDFEQNLKRVGDEYVLMPEPFEAVRPFLVALDWAGHSTNLLITSRYPFKLVDGNEDLPSIKLEAIPLMAFRDADLNKKIAELKFISESKHKDLYIKYGNGNPRLLEWFEKIAAEESKYDLDKLEAAIKDKEEDFIQEHLANVIAETVGVDFKEFLRRSSVFRIPVTEGAFNPLGDTKFLKTGVNLTLHEQETIGAVKHYWVTPVIRQRQWDELDSDEKKRIHKIAYKWFVDILDDFINNKKPLEYNHLQEAVHHALRCGNIRDACKYGVWLGNYMTELLLYRDSLLLQQTVADRITDDIIKEAIDEKDRSVSILLNDYGMSFKTLGEPAKALEYFEKALAIDLDLYGDKHSNVAVRYNNIGASWQDLDEPVKAKEYFDKSLAIDLDLYGDKHHKVAADYNNIGHAWYSLGQPQKAIGYVEKAYAFYTAAYGEEHPDTKNAKLGLGIIRKQLSKS
ncbi:MAG: tetratricopeptide repeat protein [Nitrospirae bacterium]|nr:tetratricopeptide repeat protein [Nitrospirota bacterium]